MALTNRQKVRLNIGDTDAHGFSDDEIDNFLSENGSDTDLASADALRSLAAQAAQLAENNQWGIRIQDRRKMVEAYLKMADSFQARADSQPAYGVIEISYTDWSTAEIIAEDAIENN